MKPAMVCLLQVLQGDPRAADLTPHQLEEVFDLAMEEKVLPLFLAKLRVIHLHLPEGLDHRCAAAEREIAVNTFWWTAEIRGILKTFDAIPMPVILLKGPCMAERLYGSASLRPSRDIDLLVHHNDLASAGEVLTSLGFVRNDHEDEDRHQTWRRDATMVELHYDLASRADFRFDLDRVFANARPVIFAGQAAHVLSAADELLFLCIHGIKHRYEQLCYVLDIAYASREMPQAPVFAVCPSDAKLVVPILALGYALAAKVEEHQPPFELRLRTAVFARVERVAGLLWQQLTEPEASSNHVRFPRQLYLALRPDLMTRLRYVWYISTLIREEDRALAHKWHIRSERWMFAIRPLRLLSRRLLGMR